MNSIRDRLIRFYERYNPSKIVDVDVILESFAGNEETMFDALVERYGPEPEKGSFAVSGRPASSVNRVEEVRNALSRASSTRIPVEAVASSTSVCENGTVLASNVAGRTRSSAVLLERQAAANVVEALQDKSASSLLPLHRSLERTVAELAELDFSRVIRHVAAIDAAESLEVLRILTRLRTLSTTLLEDSAPIVQYASQRGDEWSPSASATNSEASKACDTRLVPQRAEGNDSPIADASTTARAPDGRTSVLSEKIRAGARVISLYPGEYYENIVLETESGSCSQLIVELRPLVIGSRVVIRPLDASLPSVQCTNQTTLCATGITFEVEHKGGGEVVNCQRGSHARLHACHVLRGTITAEGAGTTIEMDGCDMRDGSFAGVYVKADATGVINSCTFEGCEVGLRCADASFTALQTTFKTSRSDGIVCHGSVKIVLEGCVIEDGTENGLMLSPSAQATLRQCRFARNARFGVYAPSGSLFWLSHCQFEWNVLGESNRRCNGESPPDVLC